MGQVVQHQTWEVVAVRVCKMDLVLQVLLQAAVAAAAKLTAIQKLAVLVEQVKLLLRIHQQITSLLMHLLYLHVGQLLLLQFKLLQS